MLTGPKPLSYTRALLRRPVVASMRRMLLLALCGAAGSVGTQPPSKEDAAVDSSFARAEFQARPARPAPQQQRACPRAPRAPRAASYAATGPLRTLLH